MFSLEKFLTFLPALSENAFCVAYSGGEDSHVLLHALAQCRKQVAFPLRAIHVHHGLSSQADQWMLHCQSVCDALFIPLIIEKVQLNLQPGDSVEAVARRERYAVFQRLLQPQEILVTAHTANDQTETFLLQLLRGAGVKGLSAMPKRKTLGVGFLERPLLPFSREDLHQYALQHQLKWIEDDSNALLRFNRNYLRHEVLPQIQKRWPEVWATVSRSAKHCAEASALLDELAQMDLQNETKDKLSIENLLTLSPARQRNALRYWIHQQGYLLPNQKHIEEIFQSVILADESAKPVVAWGEVEIRRHKKHLYLLSRKKSG